MDQYIRYHKQPYSKFHGIREFNEQFGTNIEEHAEFEAYFKATFDHAKKMQGPDEFLQVTFALPTELSYIQPPKRYDDEFEEVDWKERAAMAAAKHFLRQQGLSKEKMKEMEKKAKELLEKGGVDASSIMKELKKLLGRVKEELSLHMADGDEDLAFELQEEMSNNFVLDFLELTEEDLERAENFEEMGKKKGSKLWGKLRNKVMGKKKKKGTGSKLWGKLKKGMKEAMKKGKEKLKDIGEAIDNIKNEMEVGIADKIDKMKKKPKASKIDDLDDLLSEEEELEDEYEEESVPVATPAAPVTNIVTEKKKITDIVMSTSSDSDTFSQDMKHLIQFKNSSLQLEDQLMKGRPKYLKALKAYVKGDKTVEVKMSWMKGKKKMVKVADLNPKIDSLKALLRSQPGELRVVQCL